VLSRIIALSLALASVGVLGAQAPASEPTFNVVSVKPVKAPRDDAGLNGRFDVDLAWTPDQPPRPPDVDPNGPMLFDAIQDQLGLKLESTRGPVDVLVIDHVERPTED
jgi:hypothetical protein